MRHTTLVLLGIVATSVIISSAAASLSGNSVGPPTTLARSLTPNGRVIWSLDALLNDTFGNRVECYASGRNQIFSVPHGHYCPGDLASVQQYVFTFLNAGHSEFRLVRLTQMPNTGATNAPLRVGNSYVSCPGGRYHGGGHGWLVQGGGAGPNGYFWCN